jgi:ribosome-binding factor A
MIRPSKRLERLAESIQRKLAQIIQQEIRDPRLGFVTLSGVDVARDLSHAKVYFTLLSGDSQQAELVLNTASRYLRTALGRTLEARVVPQLHFVYDGSVEYGRRMSQLIKDSDPSRSNEESDE